MQRACRSPEKYHDIVLSTQKATCRYQGHLMTVNNALISYRFLNGERGTEPSPKNRICPNVRNERKQSIMAGRLPSLLFMKLLGKEVVFSTLVPLVRYQKQIKLTESQKLLEKLPTIL